MKNVLAFGLLGGAQATILVLLMLTLSTRLAFVIAAYRPLRWAAIALAGLEVARGGLGRSRKPWLAKRTA